MEEFYYQKMDRQKQAVYHGMLQGVRQLADQHYVALADTEDEIVLPVGEHGLNGFRGDGLPLLK